MECIRNRDWDPWKAAETCHTPLLSLVEPQATQELADMYPHTLDGEFQQGEHRMIWDIRTLEDRAHS
jgi:hypothetical protein